MLNSRSGLSARLGLCRGAS